MSNGLIDAIDEPLEKIDKDLFYFIGNFVRIFSVRILSIGHIC